MTKACCLFITRAHEFGRNPSGVGHFGQSLIDQPLVNEENERLTLADSQPSGLMLVRLLVDADTRGCRRGWHNGMVTTISQAGNQLHMTLVTVQATQHLEIPLKHLAALYLETHRDYVIRDGVLIMNEPEIEEGSPHAAQHRHAGSRGRHTSPRPDEGFECGSRPMEH